MSIKYKFVDTEAFTADDILIFNIKVFDKTTKKQIKVVQKCFEEYGKIANISLLGYDFYAIAGIVNCYKIEYVEAKSAAQALRLHGNINYGFMAVSCDSLEQPDGQKCLAQPLIGGDRHGIQNNQAPVMALNDDCLGNICHYLCPVDQTKFAQSCRRFAAVLSLYSNQQYKRFNYETLEGMTSLQMCLFLQVIGPQIRTLTANGHRVPDAVNLYASTFFINVKKLSMLRTTENVLGEVMAHMDLLEEVVLDGCQFDDSFIEYLKTRKYLKSLRIGRNDSIRGNEIHKLTSLEQLTIGHCENIYPSLSDICTNLTNLNYLDIMNNWLESHQYYQVIAKHLLQLKTLKISCGSGNYNCLADLPNLVSLAIDFANGEEFFAYLAEQKANQLEELLLSSENVTLKVATSVAQLKKLKVLKCFFQPDDKIMQQFAKLKELEELDFCEMFKMNFEFLKPVLENCFELQRICFWCSNEDCTILLSNALAILKEQRELERRSDCIYFILKTLSDCKIDPKILKNKSFSHILKVIEATKFMICHQNGQYNSDCNHFLK